MEPGNGGRTPE